MIFPTDALHNLRRSLLAQVEAEEIPQTEGFRRALAADPDDPLALRYLALEALERNDLDEAERYARGAMRTHPSHFSGYYVLSEALKGRDPASPLAKGFRLLASEIEMIRPTEEENLPWPTQDAEDEPASVSRELMPYRLIYSLLDGSDGVLARDVVDDIVANGERCAPLLMGILTEWGEDLLTHDNYTEVERSLALLGEIGDPAFLDTLLGFAALEDDDLAGPADWAFRRIACRRPEETLVKIRELIPDADVGRRVALSEIVGLMRGAPGRIEVIRSLVHDIDHLSAHEREAVVGSAIAGLILTGDGHSPEADAMEREYAAILQRSSRDRLREMREVAALEPEDDTTVYDICCQEPLDSDEDQSSPQEPVRRTQRPGRNDPCWCGSGKKYKKCHLSEDECTP